MISPMLGIEAIRFDKNPTVSAIALFTVQK
jgi:hypothetical protein